MWFASWWGTSSFQGDPSASPDQFEADIRMSAFFVQSTKNTISRGKSPILLGETDVAYLELTGLPSGAPRLGALSVFGVPKGSGKKYG